MESVLISIIVPAYNIENYIGRCLDSLLHQVYEKLEIVVVNDGSIDDTGRIIDQYADMDQRIVPLHKANGGVFSARLAGIEKATGEYIGFVDGDDYIEPEMFGRLLKNAMKYNTDISHCGYQMVFPDRIDYYYNTGYIVQQDRITGLKDLLTGSFIEPGMWNKLYRKELFYNLLQDEVMPKDIKINEDLLMNYWLFKEANSSVYEDFCPYRYILRRGSAATSKLNENKLKDPVRVLRIILEDSEEIPEVQGIVEERLLNQLISVAVLSATDQAELIKPFRKEIRSELRRKLPSLLRNVYVSKSVKLKVIWVVVSPSSYRWVHSVYEKVTGLDKKYNIE